MRHADWPDLCGAVQCSPGHSGARLDQPMITPEAGFLESIAPSADGFLLELTAFFAWTGMATPQGMATIEQLLPSLACGGQCPFGAHRASAV